MKTRELESLPKEFLIRSLIAHIDRANKLDPKSTGLNTLAWSHRLRAKNIMQVVQQRISQEIFIERVSLRSQRNG